MESQDDNPQLSTQCITGTMTAKKSAGSTQISRNDCRRTRPTEQHPLTEAAFVLDE
jgi:hypothetical protein